VFDLTMLALVIVCFALAEGYAGLCDDLLARRADEDGAP
jgi:hypothetical protein